MEEKRIVRILTSDKRYGTKPYRSVPPLREDWNTYLTGQHIIPGDETTFGNLTIDQMTMKVPLTVEQQRKFEYVINGKSLMKTGYIYLNN